MQTNNLKIGDRVIVQSICNSYGETGIIFDIFIHNDKQFCYVRLDNGKYKKYLNESLRKIEQDNEIMEVSEMNNEVTGNYDVALVRHISGHNTVKVYSFAMFGNIANVGDKVLCDIENGYAVCVIINILPKEEYYKAHSRVVTKEVVCKVDFTDFENRANNRKEAVAIKKQMDELLARDKTMMLYRSIAENNPEMDKLLKRYLELQ